MKLSFKNTQELPVYKDPKKSLLDLRSEEQSMRMRVLQQQSEFYAYQMHTTKAQHEEQMKIFAEQMKIFAEELAYWKEKRGHTSTR